MIRAWTTLKSEIGRGRRIASDKERAALEKEAKAPYILQKDMWAVLEKISNRITNECRDINRVTLDITSKPPGTIEWE